MPIVADLVLAGAPVTLRRFLAFRIGAQRYAIAAEDIAEIIHVPPFARLPQSPPALLGMANLRGDVIAIVDTKSLFDAKTPEQGGDRGGWRAIVLSGASRAALIVEAVETIVELDESRIETRQAELAAQAGELLSGAFLTAGGGATKILDTQRLLAAAFGRQHALAESRERQPGRGRDTQDASAATSKTLLVSFGVAGQEYALPLEEVQEIIAVPPAIIAMPVDDPVILGVTAFRDTLLPLFSLHGLLGFRPAPDLDWRAKIVVTSVAGGLVGLVADNVRAIVHADHAAIQPVSSVLTARTGGEARVRAIYRNAAGDRLISILASKTLFGDDVMKRVGNVADTAQAQRRVHGSQEVIVQFLVFRLGAEEFGLPIAAVDEVAADPEKITRLPKTPKFLEGVVNLRGDVLPVIDQRRRFEMPAFDGDPARRRLIVLRTARQSAGLIVDGVAEVTSVPEFALQPAPHLAGESTRLVHALLNLPRQNRMVLILDPDELLSRAERGLLENFAAAQKPASR